MDDLRTKYERARRAKNQANYRARKEREWAAMSWQNSQTWMKTAADAKAQALTAEREARAAREALRARDRNIERQNLLLAELQRELTITRGQLEDALAREARRDNKASHVPPPAIIHACECARQARDATERAMARIEQHARPWWQRLIWRPKSDGAVESARYG